MKPGERTTSGFRRPLPASASLAGRGSWTARRAHASGSRDFNDGAATIRELELFVASGVPVAEALKAATVNNAEILGMADRIGRIRPGFEADLIALPGDPSEEVSRLRSVSFVMKGGEVVRGDAPQGRSLK